MGPYVSQGEQNKPRVSFLSYTRQDGSNGVFGARRQYAQMDKFNPGDGL